MHNAVYALKVSVKLKVCGGVAGGLELSVDDVPVKVENDDVIKLHLVVFNSAGFDSDKSAFTVILADVAPGKSYKTVFGQKQICFKHTLFKLFDIHFCIAPLILDVIIVSHFYYFFKLSPDDVAEHKLFFKSVRCGVFVKQDKLDTHYSCKVTDIVYGHIK